MKLGTWYDLSVSCDSVVDPNPDLIGSASFRRIQIESISTKCKAKL
jgi:hypothetical protein